MDRFGESRVQCGMDERPGQSDGSRTVPFAHSLRGEARERWEPLRDHLHHVGTLASQFATAFGARDAALAAGLLHDIGKMSAAFQAYIDGAGSSPDHSSAGAIEAVTLFPGPIGRLIAFAVAGHHAGLADGAGVSGSLDARLARSGDLPDYRGWRALVPDLPSDVAPSLAGAPDDLGYTFAFLGRMLFSCLVDADFIETERFYAEAEGQRLERGRHTPLAVLRERLDRYLDDLAARSAPTPLNARRADILHHARSKAALPPGLFTMTVPTGGGKTLAGLAFALDHAIAHGLDRVVYVIPYTSIIEQTAGIFREALADADGEAPDVLEHHGNVDWDEAQTPVERDALAKLRRAAENWDVPVVVTTAVQFFESLHANRTSRCRKLHNLAKSVIVLDEAQTLPLALLRPCMAAIGELANIYRASVVLCNATQPALKRQDAFKGGLDIPDARELAPDPEGLYRALRRVAVEHLPEPVDDATIAERFAERPQMLCIVNSRKHAQALYGAIEAFPGARHLTTLMCPAHRRQVLADVRADLRAGNPVRLVSTSLIEAGVDVDFPEVWRAENGLDSIAQAAGRCNREGKAKTGRVVIFAAAEGNPPPMFRQQVDAMRNALRLHPDDPLGLAAVRAYFQQLYWSKGDDQLDAARLDGEPYPILPALHRSFDSNRMIANAPYASVAAAFRMIDDPGEPVIVRWRGAEPGEVDNLLHAIRQAPRPPGAVLRKLQQFTVSVPTRLRKEMIARGDIVVVSPPYGDRFVVLESPVYYQDDTGFQLDLPDQSFFM